MRDKILVISPHPDDLDFACAGTVAKLAEEDREISYLIVTDGSKGTRGLSRGSSIGEEELVRLREKEQREAAKLSFDNFYRFHRDHRVVAEAVFDAIYPAAHNRLFFPELLEQGYEPHRLIEVWFFGTADPNRFVDITATIDKKIEALSCHLSQIPDIDEVSELVRSRAEEVGKRAGCRYAEAFRRVGLDR
ncbi:MAG: PIG-L deacetylase family protein [Candidatus Bipolaricaulia bacterium]